MREVVIRRGSGEPADEEGLDRLLALLATGLERLLAKEIRKPNRLTIP